MSEYAKNTKANIIPCLRYRDAPAAIKWLSETFGFEKQAVYPNADGTIMHAQLTFGNGMIIIGSVLAEETTWGNLIKQPDEIGGAETQTSFLVVRDADEIYTRVKDADGEILIDIKNEDYGGRGFTCRDIEGHIWNIGTYDPW